MADQGAAAVTTVVSLSSWDYRLAIIIAILASLVFALIEITSKAKTTNLLATFGGATFFYWAVLSFGNIATTLLASTAVVKLPTALSDYYFLFSAFFGVFAFEAILKNTNITMFDKGVLTIQNWIDKALNAAAAAAIDRLEILKQKDEAKLIEKLGGWSEKEINTIILQKLKNVNVRDLDAAANAGGADPKLYKIYKLAEQLSNAERRSLLKQGKPGI